MNHHEKFTGLAHHYEASRPAYPPALYRYLFDRLGVQANSVIADIGFGTGKFARGLLERGATLYGVEPNADMRAVAHKILRSYDNLHLINGADDDSTLMDHSVDFITAAQAFHWFNVEAFKKECRRILKPDGIIILTWNMRNMDAEVNKRTYAIYKKYCTQFNGFSSGITVDNPSVVQFFDGRFTLETFENPLYFTKDKFIKRCLSASYSLREGDRNFEAYMMELNECFDRYANGDQLIVANDTIAFIGKLA